MKMRSYFGVLLLFSFTNIRCSPQLLRRKLSHRGRSCARPSLRWDRCLVGLDFWASFSRRRSGEIHTFFGAIRWCYRFGLYVPDYDIRWHFSISRRWNSRAVGPDRKSAKWTGFKLGTRLILSLAMLIRPRCSTHIDKKCMSMSMNVLKYFDYVSEILIWFCQSLAWRRESSDFMILCRAIWAFRCFAEKWYAVTNVEVWQEK